MTFDAFKNYFDENFEIKEFFCARAEPDLEFEGLLKRQHTRVKYFQGSLMNAIDLERVKVCLFDRVKLRNMLRKFW